MSLLIYSGLLYLLGISIVLTWKPEFMFSKDGSWKEFGLGRHPHKYTWMPFWLFAILWAMMSYFVVLTVSSHLQMSLPVHENVSMPSSMGRNSRNDMKQGYYILNTNETIKKGTPKYIYLGPEAPNLIYNNMELESNSESIA
jgi:hypothetical protein